MLDKEFDLPGEMGGEAAEPGDRTIDLGNDLALLWNGGHGHRDARNVRHVQVSHGCGARQEADELLPGTAIEGVKEEPSLNFGALRQLEPHHSLSNAQRQVLRNEAGLARRRLSGQKNISRLGNSPFRPLPESRLICVLRALEDQFPGLHVRRADYQILSSWHLRGRLVCRIYDALHDVLQPHQSPPLRNAGSEGVPCRHLCPRSQPVAHSIRYEDTTPLADQLDHAALLLDKRVYPGGLGVEIVGDGPLIGTRRYPNFDRHQFIPWEVPL
jgi:hypothetical protein